MVKKQRYFFRRILLLLGLFCISLVAQGEQDNTPGEEVNLQGQIPRAEFVRTRSQLGNLYRGQIVNYDFPFKNKGDGELIFSGIHATCGCIQTTVLDASGTKEKISFQPMESGLVRITFDSGGFVGPTTRTVTLETNMGSGNPTTTLSLSAMVLSEMHTDGNDLLYIGEVPSRTNRSYQFRVFLDKRAPTNNSTTYQNVERPLPEPSALSKEEKQSLLDTTTPLRIVRVTSNVPYLHPQILSTGDPKSVDILVQIDNNYAIPIGSLHAYLTLWNNSTYYKNYEIPVVGNVTGHLDVSAKYLEFGVVKKNTAARREVSFTSDEKKFQITGVQVVLKRLPDIEGLRDSDLFQIQKERVHNSDVYGYKVYFQLVYPQSLAQSSGTNADDSDAKQDINVAGHFAVKTNDPDYKEINLPFFGVIQRNK